MSKSKLYVPLMLRFSLINDQHVEIMKMMEEQIKDDKRSKNQIVMDALEYYFKRGADIRVVNRTMWIWQPLRAELSAKGRS